MSDPFISIIIPTLNEEDRLDHLLTYLKKNGGTHIQKIIIADAGSLDKTISIAEKHAVRIKHYKKKGRAVQMNEGAEIAAASVLYFLHADTIPPKKFGDQISNALRDGYECGCFQLSFDDPHPILKLYGWFTRFRTTLVRFGDQSLFVKKRLLNRVGGFDESLQVMEDQKIVRELKKEGKFKVLNARVTTSARRYRQNGIIRLQSVFF